MKTQETDEYSNSKIWILDNDSSFASLFLKYLFFMTSALGARTFCIIYCFNFLKLYQHPKCPQSCKEWSDSLKGVGQHLAKGGHTYHAKKGNLASMPSIPGPKAPVHSSILELLVFTIRVLGFMDCIWAIPGK